MKKQQHLLLAVFAIAAMAGLGSCSNDDELAAGQGKSIHTFTATMEGNPATRATFDVTNSCAAWETTDKINVNGKVYQAKSAGLTTTFEADGEDAEGESFTAYFPASLYNGGNPTLPASIEETWAEGKFNMPMYATSTTDELEFKNLCGVIAVKVKSELIASVKAIKISSGDKAISGAFTVTDNAAVLASPDTPANTLTITYTDAVPTDAAGTVFYVAVPAQEYTGLKIKLSADGTNFTKAMTIKGGASATVARNTLYPVEFESDFTGTAKRTGDIDVNWVQLWEDGPKFAEYNVGVTDGKAESYGGLYHWGGTNDARTEATDDRNTGTENLSGTDDTATNLWGENWRMPTKDELTALIENCSLTWCDGATTKYNGTNVAGYLVAGKGDYDCNNVFLPAAGTFFNGSVGSQGVYGQYWSSTHSGIIDGYYLDFDSGSQEVKYRPFGGLGFSVRAVLAE